MDKEIVMYIQQGYNPYVALARDVMKRYGIVYREIDIQVNQAIASALKIWTGAWLVPTIVVTEPGQELPFESPQPANNALRLSPLDSPKPPVPPSGGGLQAESAMRGLDRGSMIIAPNNHQLENWLHKHGFLRKPYKR